MDENQLFWLIHGSKRLDSSQETFSEKMVQDDDDFKRAEVISIPQVNTREVMNRKGSESELLIRATYNSIRLTMFVAHSNWCVSIYT